MKLYVKYLIITVRLMLVLKVMPGVYLLFFCRDIFLVFRLWWDYSDDAHQFMSSTQSCSTFLIQKIWFSWSLPIIVKSDLNPLNLIFQKFSFTHCVSWRCHSPRDRAILDKKVSAHIKEQAHRGFLNYCTWTNTDVFGVDTSTCLLQTWALFCLGNILKIINSYTLIVYDTNVPSMWVSACVLCAAVELTQILPERASLMGSKSKEVFVPPVLSGLLQEPRLQSGNGGWVWSSGQWADGHSEQVLGNRTWEWVCFSCQMWHIWLKSAICSGAVVRLTARRSWVQHPLTLRVQEKRRQKTDGWM